MSGAAPEGREPVGGPERPGAGNGASPNGRPDRMRVRAEAVLFGFEPTEVEVSVRRRPLRWRAIGAAQRMAVGLVLAPFVAVVPPHAPWLLGALGGGFLLARRRWIERLTVERVEGPCPKCGASLGVKVGRLRSPHPVACESCHHQCSLRLPMEQLEEQLEPNGAPGS